MTALTMSTLTYIPKEEYVQIQELQGVKITTATM